MVIRTPTRRSALPLCVTRTYRQLRSGANDLNHARWGGVSHIVERRDNEVFDAFARVAMFQIAWRIGDAGARFLSLR